MFAIEVCFLLGRYVATDFSDRRRAEWPPHPARLYSALVEGWADECNEAEQEALEWLASLAPPVICASQASPRAVATHFVPVNDAFVVGSLGELMKLGKKQEELDRALVADEHSPEARRLVRKAKESFEKALDSLRLKGERARQSSKRSRGGRQLPGVLPQARTRQPRTFPARIPEEPRAYFVWHADPVDKYLAVIDRIAQRVARLGHSSSLVTCRVVEGGQLEALLEEYTEPKGLLSRYEPCDGGDRIIRVPMVAQLQRLVDAYERHRGVESRVLPHRKVRYRRKEPPRAPTPHSIWSSEWIVLRRVDGPCLPVQRAPDVARAVRRAIHRYADHPLPRVLSGHEADGRPTTSPHLAVVPLPFVGHEHATGHLLGVSLWLPGGVTEPERRALLLALARWRAASGGADGSQRDLDLVMGRLGVWRLRVSSDPLLFGLRRETWSGPARQWGSVTPVALDRNPGNLRSNHPSTAARAEAKAVEILRTACVRTGLPEPISVALSFAPLIAGSRPARVFGPWPRRRSARNPARVLVHVALDFGQRIEGPVLLGAGRHFGLGLFRPLDNRRR